MKSLILSIFVMVFSNNIYAYDREACLNTLDSLKEMMGPLNKQLEIYNSIADKLPPVNTGYASLYTQSSSTIFVTLVTSVVHQGIGLETTRMLIKNIKNAGFYNENSINLKSVDLQIQNFMRSMDVSYISGLVIGEDIKVNNPNQYYYYQYLLATLSVFRNHYKTCGA